MPYEIFTVLYIVALSGLSLYGILALVYSVLFLLRQKPAKVPLPEPETWPLVTVQLPIYNEQFVVERLIDAIVSFDYPTESLSIQVLDDSTDNTLALSRQRVAYHRARGVNIELLHRMDRTEYKAGALAAGMKNAPGEFIAIFDADFVPPPDFLRRMIPHLLADPNLGMVQARWGHLNHSYSLLTRAQALFLDGHFIVEQITRCHYGLLLNFDGSAGVWRRACIEDSGGWKGDTLSEDMDLSFRAQVKGWRFGFVPDVVAPAEIPPQVAALKQQQYRWARGAFQVLLKLGGQIWGAPIPLIKRLGGFLHIGGYVTHPLMLLLLLSCLPIILAGGSGLPSLNWMSIAGFGPPLLFALSQREAYPDWKRRMLYFPFLMAMGVGMAFNNTRAVMAAFSRKPANFVRTPKFHLETQTDRWNQRSYTMQTDWTTWVELALAAYALLTTLAAAREFPPLVPVLVLFTTGFGYVSILGLLQGRKPLSQALPKEKIQDVDLP